MRGCFCQRIVSWYYAGWCRLGLWWAASSPLKRTKMRTSTRERTRTRERSRQPLHRPTPALSPSGASASLSTPPSARPQLALPTPLSHRSSYVTLDLSLDPPPTHVPRCTITSPSLHTRSPPPSSSSTISPFWMTTGVSDSALPRLPVPSTSKRRALRASATRLRSLLSSTPLPALWPLSPPMKRTKPTNDAHVDSR